MSTKGHGRGQATDGDERAQRLARALRENLHRRKAQARAQAASGSGVAPDETRSEGDPPPRSD